MIILTERAAKKIKSLQKENNCEDKPMRFFIEKGGCSGWEYGMEFATAQGEDKTVTVRDLTVVIAADSIDMLTGCEIDFDDGLHGKGFEIKNPNANAECGCGRSFS